MLGRDRMADPPGDPTSIALFGGVRGSSRVRWREGSGVDLEPSKRLTNGLEVYSVFREMFRTFDCSPLGGRYRRLELGSDFVMRHLRVSKRLTNQVVRIDVGRWTAAILASTSKLHQG